MMYITVLLVVQAARVSVAIIGIYLMSNSSLFILLPELIAHTCVQLSWSSEKILALGGGEEYLNIIAKQWLIDLQRDYIMFGKCTQ